MNRVTVAVSLALLVSCGAAESSSAGTTTADVEEAPPDETSPASVPSDPRMAAILDAHTTRRDAHCAPPLAWSEALAREAQSWADSLARRGCQFEHSQSAYGENLAAGTTGTLSPEDVVEMWYREGSRYRFPEGGFSMDTGHFTQLVWRDSRHVGCGMTACDGMDVWVCNYDPPGNVEGQYRENVVPTSCR